jgi:hypothetical protein
VTPSGCLGVVEEERKVGFSEGEKTTYTSREAQVLASDVTTRPGRVCSSLEPHWQGEGEDASSPMPSQARRLMKKRGGFQKIVALSQPVAEQQQQLNRRAWGV